MRICLLALAAILTLAACIGSGAESESEGSSPTPTANPVEPTVVITAIPCDTPTPCPGCPEQTPCPICPEPVVCPSCICPTCPEPVVCPPPTVCPSCPTCPQPAGPSIAQQCTEALAGAMMLENMLGTCELFDRPCTYEREALAQNEAFLNAYCR